MPTLVVGRAAWACKAHLAQVSTVSVAVDAPSRHGHGLAAAVGLAVGVCARHSAGRGLLSQNAWWSGLVLRGTRSVGGGRRVQLVGKGSVLQQLRRWWGQLLVVGRLFGLSARTI